MGIFGILVKNWKTVTFNIIVTVFQFFSKISKIPILFILKKIGSFWNFVKNWKIVTSNLN